MNVIDALDEPWDTFEPRRTETGEHVCWWCGKGYPAMPDGYTLCARCGTFMHTGITDPYNEAMNVCNRCRTELAAA